ncbi:MAG: hypothetical protein Tsb009_24340 [Planctomycetaceae bacterium]
MQEVLQGIDQGFTTADQLFAGWADSLSFGVTTHLRTEMYGDIATRNHQGRTFEIGQEIGHAHRGVMGNGSPGAKGQASNVSRSSGAKASRSFKSAKRASSKAKRLKKDAKIAEEIKNRKPRSTKERRISIQLNTHKKGVDASKYARHSKPRPVPPKSATAKRRKYQKELKHKGVQEKHKNDKYPSIHTHDTHKEEMINRHKMNRHYVIPK